MVATAAPLRGDLKIVGLVSTGHFFSHYFYLALPPLFPLIRAEFNASYTELGLLVSVFAIASATLQMPMGFLVDRIGALPVLIGGMAVQAGSFALMGLVPTYPVLLLLAVAGGAGNSVFHPSDYAIMTSSVSPGRLGRAVSMHSLSGFLGFAAAPVAVSLLSAFWGWRGAVIISGCVGLAIVLTLYLNRSSLRDDVIMRRSGAADDQPAASTWANFRLLLSAPMMLCLAMYIVLATSWGSIQSFAPTALIVLHDMSLAWANAGLTVFFIGATIGVLFGGVAADRTRRHEMVVTAALIAAACFLILPAWGALPDGLVIASLAAAGFATGSIPPSRDMVVRKAMPPGSAGKTFGFVSMGHDVGAALAPAVLGRLLDGGSGYESVFVLCVVSLLVGIAMVHGTRRYTHAVTSRHHAADIP